MSSQHDNDAFEMRFEDAIRKMHTRTAGGEEPNPGLWTSIRSQMGETARAETADSRAIGPDRSVASATTERNNTMDATLAPLSGGFARQQPRGISWMVLLAAGLVGIMIVSSVWLNGGSTPPNGRDDLAWAPGMGTPESSPVAEYGCDVDPLTEEEAVQIILNPFNEVLRLQGDVDQVTNTPKYMEWGEPDLSIWTSGQIPVASDDDARDEAVEAANEFWECLATGTTLQVWALMAPQTVQYEVLLKFPVIRSERDIRGYVAEFGNTQYRYSEGQFGFGPAGWEDPNDGMRIAASEPKAIRVTKQDQFAAGRFATVPMFPVEGNMLAPEVSTNLYLQQYPAGEWRVVSSRPPDSK